MDKIVERRCKICMHKDRDTIDKQLMEGIRTARDIANEFGLNEKGLSIHRHKHILTSDLREKLKLIIQDTIMEGIKPDNTDQLTKLMQFVQNMDNEDYKTGKEQWEHEKELRFEIFKFYLSKTNLFTPYCRVCGNVMEYSDSTYQDAFVKAVLALARYCFFHVEPNKSNDMGELVKAVLEPEKYVKQSIESGA